MHCRFLFRVKNIATVTNSVSVCGKPSTTILNQGEKDLLESVGIHLDEPVRCYSQLFLKDCGKLVTTDTKRTLRDNSCVQYTKEGSSEVGILHKVIQAGETLAFVKKLVSSGETLCTDTTTHAQIGSHYLKVRLPRYVAYTLLKICL